MENLEELLELASKENDTVVLKDCGEKLSLLLNQIKKTEVECFLSGENDHLDTYLEIHAGAGGTESQDWAQMLRRMYSKWKCISFFYYIFNIFFNNWQSCFCSSFISA